MKNRDHMTRSQMQAEIQRAYRRGVRDGLRQAFQMPTTTTAAVYGAAKVVYLGWGKAA